jgi:GNAT superfamily N-acetyltransferase
MGPVSVVFRRAAAGDLPFVISSWSSSYRTSYYAGLVTMNDWADVMHVQLRKILARPSIVTCVAHDPDEDLAGSADLLGFIAGDVADRSKVPLVLYVFVKAHYRGNGVARGLFNALGVDPSKPFDFACKTPVVRELERKIPYARWSPLRARFEMPKPEGTT